MRTLLEESPNLSVYMTIEAWNYIVWTYRYFTFNTTVFRPWTISLLIFTSYKTLILWIPQGCNNTHINLRIRYMKKAFRQVLAWHLEKGLNKFLNLVEEDLKCIRKKHLHMYKHGLWKWVRQFMFHFWTKPYHTVDLKGVDCIAEHSTCIGASTKGILFQVISIQIIFQSLHRFILYSHRFLSRTGFL